MAIDLANVRWYGHDGFVITAQDGRAIWFDPYRLPPLAPKADVIFVSHEHFDHCSPEDIEKVKKDSTVIIGPAEVAAALKEKVTVVKPGDQTVAAGLSVAVTPAYNVNKWREPNVAFHPPADGKVGYVVAIDGLRYYHAGDTDHIPEMASIKTDVAFLPVSGVYVMTAAEAVEAAATIKPQVAVPMHYGSIVGSVADAQQFAKRASVPVVVLEKVTP